MSLTGSMTRCSRVYDDRDVMLPPGLLSIIADIAGIIFISLGGMPVLKEIGFGGAVWLAASLTMVFVVPADLHELPAAPDPRRSWRKRARRPPASAPLTTGS